jgi:hypothetical protein
LSAFFIFFFFHGCCRPEPASTLTGSLADKKQAAICFHGSISPLAVLWSNKKNQPQVSLVPQPEHPPFFFKFEDILNP